MAFGDERKVDVQSARNGIAREISPCTRCIAKPPFSRLYSLAIGFFCICESVACISCTRSIQRSQHTFSPGPDTAPRTIALSKCPRRSEEHTSELQSLTNL